MRLFSAIMLALTTVATISVMWVRAKWATAIPEVSMCLLAALWGIFLFRGRSTVKLAWLMLPLGGVVALAATQIITGTTVYSWPTRMAALYWAGNLAVFFIALQIFRERAARVKYLDILLSFSVFLAVFCVIQGLTGGMKVYWTFEDPLVYGRRLGPFLYDNQYAAFVEILLPLALFGALTRQRGRILCAVAAAVLFGSVVYSGSRGGVALTLFELAVVPILAARRGGVSRQQFLSAGAVVAVAVLWVMAVAGPERLIGKLEHGDLFASRREFNQSSLVMIQARPLQGFGLGNWVTAYPGYALFDDDTRANQAHNDWLQWAVEGGIPMLLMMLSVAIWAIPRAIRSIWGFGVAIIFIHCLWDYPIQRTGVAIVFFTMMAAIAPYGRPERKPALPPPATQPATIL